MLQLPTTNSTSMSSSRRSSVTPPGLADQQQQPQQQQQQAQQRPVKGRTFYCEAHRGEPVRLYCVACQAPICAACHAHAHSEHKCTDVQRALEECKERLQLDIDRVVCRASERTNMRQALRAERKKLLEQVGRAESEVNERSEELKRLVEEHRCALLQELHVLKERRLREFEPVREQIDEHLAALERFRSEARDLRERSAPAHVLRVAGDLHSRAEELQRTPRGGPSGATDCFTSCDVSLAMTSLQEFADSEGGENIIGRVVVKRETTTADIVVRRQARLVAGGCVMGLAQLADRLYVACYKSSSLRVYDAASCERLADVIVAGMTYPCDVAACGATGAVYVTDSGNKCAWKVRLGETKTVTERWMEGVRLPYSISVCADGRVLLLSRPSRLSVYRPNARRLHVIALPADLKDPWHAVETQSGSFVVAHGCSFNLIHRVCEVSRTGAMLRVFGGPPGPGPGQLDQPIRVALDGDGRVFVVDWRGRRIVLLDSQLGRDRVLLGGAGGTGGTGGDEAHEPQRICYVKETGRLVVGMDTGAVDIYSVHQRT